MSRRPPTRGVETLPVGGASLRIENWRGGGDTAHVLPLPDRRPPSEAAVRRCLLGLADRGYRHALTSALSPDDQVGFLAAGFTVHERLHLLIRNLGRGDLTQGPRDGGRRGRRTDRGAVLTLDRSAFTPFWQLDESGLADAIAATPSARFRVVEGRRGELSGYAIFGRAGRRGYVQRLAVHPDDEGQGLGTALVADGMRWMRRRGVNRVMVNTQRCNQRALDLYERLGFARQRDDLAVLTTPVAPLAVPS